MAVEGESEDERSRFLLELAQALHLAALPADQVEEHVRAAALGLGLGVEVFTAQSLVLLEVNGPGQASRVALRRIPFETHWNLRRGGEVGEVARAVAGGRLGATAARAQLERIAAQGGRYGKPLVVGAYGVYGAAVAARVGGGWRELVPAALIGLVAGAIHFGTSRRDKVDLLQSFLAALAGTLGAYALAFVLPPFMPGPAVFGGMTLLVPAMVVTIGVHELANSALESGTVRLAYGMLRFLMLAFGLGAALALAGLIVPWPAHAAAVPLPRPVVVAAVAIGGLALVVCLQGRRRDAPWIVAGAVLAYVAQELTRLIPTAGGGDHRGSPLLAAFVLGVAAHLYARRPGRFAATMVVPGLLQLAPGFLGSQASFHLLEGGGAGGSGGGGGDASFFRVLLVALQLGTGLLLASLLFRPRRR